MTYWMTIMLTMTKTMRMMKVINFTFTITSHNTWKHLLGRPNALAKILLKFRNNQVHHSLFLTNLSEQCSWNHQQKLAWSLVNFVTRKLLWGLQSDDKSKMLHWIESMEKKSVEYFKVLLYLLNSEHADEIKKCASRTQENLKDTLRCCLSNQDCINQVRLCKTTA